MVSLSLSKDLKSRLKCGSFFFFLLHFFSLFFHVLIPKNSYIPSILFLCRMIFEQLSIKANKKQNKNDFPELGGGLIEYSGFTFSKKMH